MVNTPSVTVCLLSEQELSRDAWPHWPFRLVLRDWYQRQPDGSFRQKSLTIRLPSDVMADLLAQGRAHEKSYAMRVMRQGQDRRAATEALTSGGLDVETQQVMLQRVLVGLQRLPDAPPCEPPAA